MAFRLRRFVVVSFIASAVVGIWACAGDRLVLPEQEAGPGPLPGSDASCTQCSGECVDTRTDPRHCGNCGTACAPGSVCSSGTCAQACPPTEIACAGGCVDPQTSKTHCGAKGDC